MPTCELVGTGLVEVRHIDDHDESVTLPAAAALARLLADVRPDYR